ncbi:eukaryotic translation initiation factor 4E-1A-like isoform X4 [Xiphias gladius]|uniref:eukaryotic translation initiation factor 4E-1A-like isoform X4 n=1 Tax=Xiphias gladius TaxID=8245 RepID=UPI001A98CF15|nr:eukaryotic translation initiation factor 4E-1A-like isoform X4 [Xiphias gladius]
MGCNRILLHSCCALDLQASTSVPANPEKEKCQTAIQNVASPEAYIKHPLQNKWALWFFKNDKSKTWQANLRLISKFDTVEDFWALYNHIQLSSNLMSGCDYSLFKLLCLVGEAFDDYSDDVCGAVINVRAKGDKIAIWTTDYENKEAITHIGRVYKERLGVPPKVIIGYQSHADTATKSGSTTKNKFVA